MVTMRERVREREHNASVAYGTHNKQNIYHHGIMS